MKLCQQDIVDSRSLFIFDENKINMLYTIENISKYLNFKIDNIENVKNRNWDYPKLSVKSLKLLFPDYSDFSNFLYCMKRQNDFGTDVKSNSNRIDVNSLHKTIAFDSGFNVISNRHAEEGKSFIKDLDTYHKMNEKCLWGDYIDHETLEIKTSTKKEILEYSLLPTQENTQKVLIKQPEKNHDESIIVYVKTEIKPNKSLVVSYIFEKKKNDLIFTHLNKNDWIF